MKKKFLYFGIGITILIGIIYCPIKFTYIVYSTGKVFPTYEWVLGRTYDGRITETIKNNQLGLISSYAGKEFQRGDVFDFYINPEINDKQFVERGEMIGVLNSTELMRQINQLKGEREVEKALLKVYSTGQKIQTIKEAETNLTLAKERFSIQDKLISRQTDLYKDSLISPQQYDIAKNDYELSKINLALAEAQIKTLSTGEKPEQIKFIVEKIENLTGQIASLESRRDALQIKAPFAGLIQRKKGGQSTVEVLANIVDTSSYIIVTPIKIKEFKNLSKGQKCKLSLFNTDCEMEATICHIDNAIQIIGGKQAIYVTAKIDKKCPGVYPGIFAQTNIECGKHTIIEYSKLLFQSLFYR
ncbi:MAG: HlyD family efflux transporter periplasmic adaptor subunit [Sporocytophaga sp.]|uniref:HlyD family secretion protein n=1 Tax=Sporocytophaga sp. TaxID=2231183 RepID=UPI001B1A2427|nr:HlyD family efflux transporter periplasmic adaptor subunit [Sporocytophaga sp.]MBO9701118.1 HlyD family efflux transporter periplasmic adaptor subunit [Sporocytophaga sp.]